MASEELLPGNVAGAVRVGDTVRRPTGPWTPAVHALLGHLATRIPHIPRVLGFDELGREIDLTVEVGPASEPPWICWWSESQAHANAGHVAVLLGRPRDAETHFRHALADGDRAPHNRAISLCGLAVARVQARELDGACRAATEAATLARRLGSERVRSQLVEFRRVIQPHAAANPVNDFEAKCADLLRAATVTC